MRSWLSALLLVAACGTDVRPVDEGGDDSPIEPIAPDACETSYLDYNNFGAPFVINWCRGCHSSSVPQGECSHSRRGPPPAQRCCSPQAVSA